jgi:hypothetical protein
LDNKLKEEARLLTIFYSFDDDTDTKHFIYHKSKQDLMLFAALGCHLCSLAGNTSWNPFLELGKFSFNGGNADNTGRHQSEDIEPSNNAGPGGFETGDYAHGDHTSDNQSRVIALLEPTPPGLLE